MNEELAGRKDWGVSWRLTITNGQSDRLGAFESVL